MNPILFRKRRLTKAAHQLSWHLAKMSGLEHSRDNYDMQALDPNDEFAANQKAMALAVNYELVSHASRALAELRKTEELAPDAQLSSAESMRRYLMSRASLPAISYNATEVTSRDEIERRYQEHLEGKTAWAHYFGDA